MGKTLETKKKILNLLKKKNMTASELSRELNLSTATVSQHLDELRQMGAIEKMENEHFKKLKYYRPVQMVNTNMVKYVIGILAVLVLASVAYLYANNHSGSAAKPALASKQPFIGQASSIPQGNSTTIANSTPMASGLSVACPMITYMLSGNITGSSGFSQYSINSSMGTMTDYVISPGSAGMLRFSEHVYGLLQNPGFSTNRTHYASLQNITAYNASAMGISLNFTPQAYNVANNATLNSTLMVMVNQSAPEASYILRIDGPCGGGVGPMVLTVGSSPYNGTIIPAGGIYA